MQVGEEADEAAARKCAASQQAVSRAHGVAPSVLRQALLMLNKVLSLSRFVSCFLSLSLSLPPSLPLSLPPSLLPLSLSLSQSERTSS